MKDLLAAVIAAVEAEGERLAAEFLRPGGPRGRRGNAPVDREIEERLRETLQALVPCPFAGEETDLTPGPEQDALWMVDPHDGTFEFTGGRRGTAISVALLRKQSPVLGVVHSPLSPDRGRDTIAWAEGAGPIRRNGRPLDVDLAQRLLGAGEFVFATGSSALRPGAWARAVAPARYIAMPSIAYRLARVAAGDAVATVSTHAVNEYDIAAGMALMRAAGGVVLDAQGKAVVLEGKLERRLTGCFAGAPGAAGQLAAYEWKALENEPPLKARVSLGFPRKSTETRVERAQGCLLGQVIGDSLGSLVEFKSAAEIARLHPGGVRNLADGGVYHTIAGQPTDDSEMALALGVDVKRLFTLVFGLGAALCALAGAMLGPLLAVQVGMGENILIQAFVVVVIGGIGSIRGALVGALLVGMVDTIGRAFLPVIFRSFMPNTIADALGPTLAAMAVFILMAAVLYWKPTGLFPARG